MKKISGIFQLLLALFFGVALVFFLLFDSVKNGFGLQELNAGKVVIWLLVGLVLFLISWVTNSVNIKNLNNRIKRLESEKNEIKARLYDLQQDTKTTVPPPIKPDPLEDDKDGSGIRPRENFK